MGAIHQLASASLAAVFSIGMLMTAHLFIEHRSARSAAISAAQPVCLYNSGAHAGICRGFDGVL
jgi:hypothetical protein